MCFFILKELYFLDIMKLLVWNGGLNGVEIEEVRIVKVDMNL